jgi:hypothetical protein
MGDSMTFQKAVFVLAALATLGGCNSSTLPPGANYISPFSAGVAPARLYSASVRSISGSLTAYNLLPICGNDFAAAKELKNLTSSQTLNYGTLTVTDGPEVLANLAGIPITSYLTGSAGFGYSNRNTMSFNNAQLVQVDNEGAPFVIANYIKRRGRGTPEKPSCLDVVQRRLNNGEAIIVTQAVITSQQATIAPESGFGMASCSGADSGNAATSATIGSTTVSASGTKIAATPSGVGSGISVGTINVGTGQQAAPQTGEKSKPQESQAANKSASAPISGCLGLSLTKAVSFNLKGAGGQVFTQTVPGAVIAIIPSSLPL